MNIKTKYNTFTLIFTFLNKKKFGFHKFNKKFYYNQKLSILNNNIAYTLKSINNSYY